MQNFFDCCCPPLKNGERVPSPPCRKGGVSVEFSRREIDINFHEGRALFYRALGGELLIENERNACASASVFRAGKRFASV